MRKCFLKARLAVFGFVMFLGAQMVRAEEIDVVKGIFSDVVDTIHGDTGTYAAIIAVAIAALALLRGAAGVKIIAFAIIAFLLFFKAPELVDLIKGY